MDKEKKTSLGDNLCLHDRLVIAVIQGVTSRDDYTNIEPNFIASYANNVAASYIRIKEAKK